MMHWWLTGVTQRDVIKLLCMLGMCANIKLTEARNWVEVRVLSLKTGNNRTQRPWNRGKPCIRTSKSGIALF